MLGNNNNKDKVSVNNNNQEGDFNYKEAENVQDDPDKFFD